MYRSIYTTLSRPNVAKQRMTSATQNKLQLLSAEILQKTILQPVHYYRSPEGLCTHRVWKFDPENDLH